MNIVSQNNSNVRGRRRGIHLYVPLPLSTWFKRLTQEVAITGRRRGRVLDIPDPRYKHQSYLGRTVHHKREEHPLNTLARYGIAYFIFEVKQLIEVERAARGYYPPLPEIYDIIKREFGADFAAMSRLIHLPYALRRCGAVYSEAGAAAYHSTAATLPPLLDLSAPYALPWGTVNTYLMWKLPRLEVWDSFEVDGVVIRRSDNSAFTLTGGGRCCTVSADGLSEAIARVLMVLRGAEPKDDAMLPPLVPIRAKPLKASTPAPAPVNAAPAPQLPALPALIYSSTDERRALAVEYTAKGYSMAAIQAALVRADLANGSEDTVQ